MPRVTALPRRTAPPRAAVAAAAAAAAARKARPLLTGWRGWQIAIPVVWLLAYLHLISHTAEEVPAPAPRRRRATRRSRDADAQAASQAALRQSSMRRARRQRCCPLRRSAATLKPRPAPRMHRAIGVAALPSPASQPPAGSLSLHFALNTPFPFPLHPLHRPLTPPSAARAAVGHGEEARRPTLR